MTDPYEILGLPADSDDDSIRRRYLELVKQFSPEHHPEKFAAIRRAYDNLRDLDTRLRYRLFEAGQHENIDALIEVLQCRTVRRRLSLQTILSAVSKPLSPLAIDRILAEFRLWLEAIAGQDGWDSPPAQDDEANVDVAMLVGQFTALRHEVNLQTRASRGQMEQGAQILEELTKSLDTLQNQQAEGDTEEKRDEAIRPMLKSLVDAYDSLNLAQREVQRIKDNLARREGQRPVETPASEPQERPAGEIAVKVPWTLRLLGLGAKIDSALSVLQSRWQDAQAAACERLRAQELDQQRRLEAIESRSQRIAQNVQSILTGYGMSLQRLERMLEQQGLEPIEAVGEMFDPERMEALELVIDPSRSSGEVVEEVRRGYLWRGKVFRFAQVKVARG